MSGPDTALRHHDAPPDTRAARLRRAALLHGHDDLDGAEALYRDVLADDPDDPVAAGNLGLLVHQRGDVDAAVELLERALAAHESPSVLVNLANARAQRGELERARELAERAV